MVEPFVVRKTIKQTVMTTVYGVTFIGAKKQIYERLMDHAYPGGPLEVRRMRISLSFVVVVLCVHLLSCCRLFRDFEPESLSVFFFFFFFFFSLSLSKRTKAVCFTRISLSPSSYSMSKVPLALALK